MDQQDTHTSISAWDENQFLYDMQGPIDMTYNEAYTEVMKCFMPIKQAALAPHSPTCGSPAESFTTYRFDGLSEISADMSNPSFSAPPSRSQSPASPRISHVDHTAIHKLSKRQKNREAQRAYRERKEKLLQTLAEKVEKLEAAYNAVKDERDQLQRRLHSLTNPPPLAKDSVLGYDDQFGTFADFQFNNFLFSNLPRQQTILPLS